MLWPIYTSLCPPEAIDHKSRSDQKLRFLERREQMSNSSSSSISQLARFKQSWTFAQDSGFVVQRLVKTLYPSIFMTLCYFNTMFLFIMFLVCSSYMLDIVMIDDEFMHMFAKRLAQYSSEISGNIVYLRMHSTLWAMWQITSVTFSLSPVQSTPRLQNKQNLVVKGTSSILNLPQ